jgi:hypothetical protein
LFDPNLRQLEERQEELLLSWYASDGQIATHRTAPSGAVTAGNRWVAPERRGEARLWVVIRDGRGGVGWGSVVILVR